MERKKLCYEFLGHFYPFGYALNIGSLITNNTRKNFRERIVSESNHTKCVWLRRQSENEFLIKHNVTIECRCRMIAFKLSDNDEFRFANFKELHIQACKLYGNGLICPSQPPWGTLVWFVKEETVRTEGELTLRSKVSLWLEISIHYPGSTASSVNEEVPQVFQRTDLWFAYY